MAKFEIIRGMNSLVMRNIPFIKQREATELFG
jgi:hypothetical protein